jgi:hypothetical protein
MLVNIAVTAFLMGTGAEADKAAVDKKLIMILGTDPKLGFFPGASAEKFLAEQKNCVFGIGQISLPDPFPLDL